MPAPHRPVPSRDPRAARLEARLAVYAQYAALLGDEVAAAWSGEPAQAGALTRELAAERRALAERHAELGDWAEHGGPLTPEAFGTVLAGAVTELGHQASVNRALRERLDALQASGWVPMGGEAARRALLPAPPAAAPCDPDEAPASARDAEALPTSPTMPTLLAGMGGALVAARSNGVGGLLGGRYPGLVAGADTSDYVAATTDVHGPTPSARVDVRL